MTTLQLVTLITAIIGAGCGILGAVLGIINTWHQMSRTRVRLRVVPKLAWMIDSQNFLTADRPARGMEHSVRNRPPDRVCIEIINLSAFPVTVSDVGFGRVSEPRGILFRPELSPGKTWPVRLESRECFTAYGAAGMTPHECTLKDAVAYATTDCGTTTYGSSPIFKDFVRSLKARKDSKT